MKRNKARVARRGKAVSISSWPILPDTDLYRLLALIARRIFADSPTTAVHRGGGPNKPPGSGRGDS